MLVLLFAVMQMGDITLWFVRLRAADEPSARAWAYCASRHFCEEERYLILLWHRSVIVVCMGWLWSMGLCNM
jgi:hypothetical protein